MSVIQQIKSFLSGLKSKENTSKLKPSALTSHQQIEAPPQHLMDMIGNGNYEQIGKSYLNYFKNLGHLQPGHRVLDIGCGVGRMAIPLTQYLDTHGSYEGFDIVKSLIDWCKENITPRFSNFHFRHADILNSSYNPFGKQKGEKYRFGFPDVDFDFIFLTSVFTHMMPAEMEQYISEIERTLKPGGRCLVTYFMLNESVYPLIENKKSTFDFNFQLEGCRIQDPAIPEAVVAFEETNLRALFIKHSLQVDSIHYGSWSGRSDYFDFQDIIVLKKPFNS